MISFRINIQSSIEENKNLKSKINSYIEGQEQIYINAEKVESYWNDDNIKTFIEYITNDRKKVNALEDTILSCTEINNNYFIKLDTILEQNDIPYKNKYLIYNSDDCQKSINNKCWCGGKGNFLHCWWACKLVQLWETVRR